MNSPGICSWKHLPDILETSEVRKDMAGIRGGGHRNSEDICSQRSPGCASFLPEPHFYDLIPGAKQSSPTKLPHLKTIPFTMWMNVVDGNITKRAPSHIRLLVWRGEGGGIPLLTLRRFKLVWLEFTDWICISLLGVGVCRECQGPVSLCDWYSVALVFWKGAHFQP